MSNHDENNAILKWQGRVNDVLPANTDIGVPLRMLVEREMEDRAPMAYRLRLLARCFAGTAQAVTVSHVYRIDDGFGGGAREVVLTTSLATGLQNEAYAIIEGVARYLTVEVSSVPSATPTTARGLLVTAAAAVLT